jgi:hypothetical protein
VCDRWRFGENGKSGFECFLADVGLRPSPDLTLDRLDNNGDYERKNVRWATRKEQNRNTRRNRIVDIGAGPVCLSEAIERWGAVHAKTVRSRIWQGWDIEDAIVTPADQPRPLPFVIGGP